MELTFYKARNTLIEMMKDRGYYHPAGLDSFSMSFEDFSNLFKNSGQLDQVTKAYPTSLDMFGIFTKEGAGGLPVYVRVLNGIFSNKEIKFFTTFDKNKAQRSDFIPVADYHKMPLVSGGEFDDFKKKIHTIIVYRSPLKKDSHYDISLETEFLEEPNVEAFPVHKLTFNVTKHVLVSPHKLLSEEEKAKVYEKFNTSRQMCPKMCIDDPVNMYYDGKPGDMYQITRTAYRPSYRVVASRPLPRKK